jgi:tRNA-splicing ligase RtcB (3'-phosphate/5'-hydroxy nucleic acid ligase)
VPVRMSFKDADAAPVLAWTADIEDSALQQLHNMSKLPFIHQHIAVMPDCHWGMGSTVGSVIPTIRAIVPAAVGVDIGCGMVAHKLSIRPDQLPDNLLAVRGAIEAAVPHGRTNNGKPGDRGAWHNIPDEIAIAFKRLAEDERYRAIAEGEPKALAGHVNAERHLGTLGTGNHFIELCLDKEDGVWLMLHSGSRGIGNRLGSYFIARAKEDMERHGIALPDKDLAYFTEDSAHFAMYWKAVSWAQDFAFTNRALMIKHAHEAVCRVLELTIGITETAVNCHHNYVAVENHFGADVYVTRKGAVRARVGDMGIIPGSMGARSFIVRGKGSPESFCSCSHGAGRRMSRSAARKQFTIEDLAAQTAGVECRKDADVIDEIPGAYKSIQEVMDNQSDLVEIVAELKQVICVKG